MLGPSSFILPNRTDIYSAIPQQDPDGGPQFPHGPTPKYQDQPCSVQYVSTEEDEEIIGRVTVINWYHIIYGFDPQCNPKDTIIWTDPTPNRILIVAANPPSEGGKRSA